MKFLITGGNGFIGSNFLNFLLTSPEISNEIDVINLDKRTYAGRGRNLEYLGLNDDPRYEFIEGDICDRDLVTSVFEREAPDFVFNFAAESHVDRSIEGSEPFVMTNILGTTTLLDVARKFPVVKFIQISTDEVYGSLNLESLPSKEDDKIRTSSPYSATKASAEMLCFAAMKTFGQPIIITRSSNNFGPLQFPEKLIPLFITNLLENKKVPLYGEGKNIRDWIYVQDNCEAIDFLIHNGKLCEAYNIGGGNELTNLDLTRQILDKTGKDEYSIEKVQDRPGHDLRYSLNCSKIRSLGWNPRFSFYEALDNTVEWYKRHPEWWKPLKERSKIKYKYLIIGKGFIGKRLGEYLGENAIILENKIKTVKEVVNTIKFYGSEIVINCAGNTGNPNIDSCENDPEKTFFENIFVPLIIVEACKKTKKKMVHFGTGGIYDGNNFFKEDDEPNFVNSLYVRTKYNAEKILNNYKNVLQIRINLPIDEIPHDRNLIDKILKFSKNGGKILVEENSITPVPFLIETTKKLIDLNKTGIFNVVAKNSMTHDLILDIYQEISGEQLNYEKINAKELDTITDSRKSNCTLSTDKLASCGIEVPDVKESIRDCVRKYILNKSGEVIQ